MTNLTERAQWCLTMFLIRDDDCHDHPWPGSHRDQYAMVTVPAVGGGTRRTTAHAWICELHHGPKPSPNHQVRHLCGRPSCCNPLHLVWGLPIENAADRVRHGHTRSRPHVKPRVRKVIGAMAATGLVPHRQLAAQVGVSERTISTWAHQAA
jgi:hypothetical protein